MIERRPDSCDGAGFMAAVYTASILSTAATKRAAPSSVSVVAGPILESLRDNPQDPGPAPPSHPRRRGPGHSRYYLPKLLTMGRPRCSAEADGQVRRPTGRAASREEPHV